MKPFIHRSVVGDFFDVLQTDVPGGQDGAVSPLIGETKRHEAVISVYSGDFSLRTLPDFAASLEKLLTSIGQVVVLDLSRVGHFSANAASVLVNFLASVEGRNKRLVLYRPSDTIKAMLTSLNILYLFEILLTEEELLLALPD